MEKLILYPLGFVLLLVGIVVAGIGMVFVAPFAGLIRFSLWLLDSWHEPEKIPEEAPSAEQTKSVTGETQPDLFDTYSQIYTTHNEACLTIDERKQVLEVYRLLKRAQESLAEDLTGECRSDLNEACETITITTPFMADLQHLTQEISCHRHATDLRASKTLARLIRQLQYLSAIQESTTLVRQDDRPAHQLCLALGGFFSVGPSSSTNNLRSGRYA